MNVSIKEAAENRRWFIEFNEPTPKGERLVVEITLCEADPKNKYALPYIAKKNGLSDKMLSHWWSVQTYTYDEKGCWGEQYNPTNKREAYERIEDGKPETHYRYTIDFDWWLEATEENARKILEEIERRAYQL